MWAPNADPINAAFAAEGIRSLAAGLPKVVADPMDLDGREHALYAAYLSATAFASAGSGLHHKICHVLGGKYNLPHAQTHATVLPYVLAFNGPAAPAAERRIAAAFSLGAASALDGLVALKSAELNATARPGGLRLRRGVGPRGRGGHPPLGPALQPAPGHRRGHLPRGARSSRAAWSGADRRGPSSGTNRSFRTSSGLPAIRLPRVTAWLPKSAASVRDTRL